MENMGKIEHNIKDIPYNQNFNLFCSIVIKVPFQNHQQFNELFAQKLIENHRISITPSTHPSIHLSNPHNRQMTKWM